MADDGLALLESFRGEALRALAELENAQGSTSSTLGVDNGAVFERARVAIVTSERCLRITAYPRHANAPATLFEVSASGSNPAVYSGRAELWPNHMNEDDAYQFHCALKRACDAHQDGVYGRWKQAADEATFDRQQQRYRPVGGIKFDQVQSAAFVEAFLYVFLYDYVDIVRRRIKTAASDEERQWMQHSRFELLRSLVRTAPEISDDQLPPSAQIAHNASGYAAKASGSGDTAEQQLPRPLRDLQQAARAPRPSYVECLFLQAIRGVSVARPPVWLHRQAGRYLPEYRETKGDRGFLETTGDPVIAAEITLQPVRRYNVDCAIIFSDIMTIPQALGMELVMNPGPFFPHPIRTREDAEQLKYQPDILQHVYDALRETRKGLAADKALVGFCGAPWTLMAYMIGKELAKKWLHMHPDWAEIILSKCTEVAIDYLSKQIEAGADVVQVFDSNAADLGPDDYFAFSFPYVKRIAEGVKARHPHTPMTLFPRGACFCIKRVAQETLYDCVSVDWATDPAYARQLAGPHLTLQGNLEPDIMYEPTDQIRRKVRRMINAFGKHRYIVNLGHGMKPDMPVEAAGALIEEAQKVVIGSRNSPLAMAQAEIVLRELKTVAPQHRFEIIGVATKGDKILDVPLAKIGDKGLFTKELEWGLLRGDVDIVQHSLKDLETTLPDELTLGSVLKRDDHRDSLVSASSKRYTLKSLPHGARVGTSSLRRISQIRCLRPDLDVRNIRGNLNTRLTKLLNGDEYDAILLAMAGIRRLDTSAFDIHVEPLDETVFVPAVSQGAIGIETRADDLGVLHLVRAIEDRWTRKTCDEERAFLRTIQGGCQVPVACRTWKREAAGVQVEAHVWSVDGVKHLQTQAATGTLAAAELNSMGAAEIINSIRM
ncbi:Uroporphyrinogen decarboxylase in heme biosynthesis [Sorochytrium milnesiophthora]